MVLVSAPPEVRGGRRRRRLTGILGDVALALLLGSLFPFAILAVGLPIVLVLRLLIEIVSWF